MSSFVRLALLSILASAFALAQTGQGIIVGTVNDSTGAIIPSVGVRITNTQTGFVHTATTNEEGLYRVPYLNPGMYEIAFESQGFKKFLRTNIQVRSTETTRVDVTLEVGTVVDTVEVGAAATVLETETSATGHLVTGTELVKLPTPQMKIESMLWYVPGVTSQSGVGHTAGSRSRAFTLANDGVSGLTPGTGTVGTGRNMSTAEHNMQEVKILTTALPAEYGHSGGGMMNITYKSGTNQLHGLAEERYMARHFIHRNWQDATLPTNNFGFHLMSGNISGPVRIPKLYNGSNRTFFLIGFQRHHEKASENNDRTVPSPAMLAGDFSFGGIGNRIFDPATLVATQNPNGTTTYTRTQFPGNQIPLSRVDPVFNKFMSFNPYNAVNNRNNQTVTNASGVSNNISADTVYRSYRTGMDFKGDQSFSDRHKLFGRYSYFRHRSFQDRWQVNVRNPIFDRNVTPIPIDQRQLVVSDTITVSPTIVQELRIGFNRRKFSRFPESLNQNWAGQLGIPNVGPETMPTFRLNTTDDNIITSNTSAHALLFAFPGGGQFQVNESLSLQDNVTMVRGRHTFKTGFEVLRTRHNVLVESNPSGITG